MVARHEEDEIYNYELHGTPDAYGGYLDPAPGYQYEDGPIAESNFGFALSNSTAEFVFDQLYTYENNDEDLGATFE